MTNRVFVAGDKGMVGSAIVRRLNDEKNIKVLTQARDQLDLSSTSQVTEFFNSENIDQVYLAAAKVGGILANSRSPNDFLLENLKIQLNVIEAAHQNNIQDILFLGSSCIYPRLADQPIQEEALLTGHLEPTNEGYAIAKISGIKLCETYNQQFGRNYRSVMPTNLYGPNDNYHILNSHVLPAFIRKFHEAKVNNHDQVEIWGTGKPRREFLYVEDLADACVYIMNLDESTYQNNITPNCSHINIGTGKDCSIIELAEMIASLVGFQGEIILDTSKPDGIPRKLLNIDRLMKIGWQSSTTLKAGLEKTYKWFISNQEKYRS